MSAPTRHRVVLGGLVAASWTAAGIVKFVVRPIVAGQAPEWLSFVLGSTPSLLGGLSVPLCFLAVHPRPGVQDVRRACIWAAALVLSAELLERRLPGSTFDWVDLAASLIGVGCAAVVYLSLSRVGSLQRSNGPV